MSLPECLSSAAAGRFWLPLSSPLGLTISSPAGVQRIVIHFRGPAGLPAGQGTDFRGGDGFHQNDVPSGPRPRRGEFLQRAGTVAKDAAFVAEGVPAKPM